MPEIDVSLTAEDDAKVQQLLEQFADLTEGDVLYTAFMAKLDDRLTPPNDSEPCA